MTDKEKIKYKRECDRFLGEFAKQIFFIYSTLHQESSKPKLEKWTNILQEASYNERDNGFKPMRDDKKAKKPIMNSQKSIAFAAFKKREMETKKIYFMPNFVTINISQWLKINPLPTLN